MTKQDIGFYLMVLLISSVLTWVIDAEGLLPVKTKVLMPIIITLIVALLRISIYLMIGE